MRRGVPVVMLLLLGAVPAQARGLLIPVDKTIPPLAMLSHQVTITIDDQVAVTRVEQTFRNHTSRALEATYVFPVPRGASVRKFSMWVNGTEVRGEMLEADKARQIYTDIVRRTQDPGLLEYIGNDLLRMRVFPVAAQSDQKVAVSFTSIAPKSADLVEYVYPLKSSAKAVSTLEKFSVKATIKSQHPVLNVYSPSHALNLQRANDREVSVSFERDQAALDKDFQLFYALGDKDVGLTALAHRPLKGENGYFLLLVSPRVEMPKDYVVPRDVVLVLDTSGSMRGPKLQQAKKALKYCLDNLDSRDRFAVINFATAVNRYKDGLVPASTEQVAAGRKWVDELESTGGTAIDDALSAALQLRAPDDSRTFTVVFFTDGQPTIGETNPDKILQNVSAKNSANTRIFTFGVGDDVNATMLDQLADRTRAVSTYVRPAEDIEVKVSGLYGKISHPVLANLKLSAPSPYPLPPGGEGRVRGAVELVEMYPPQLPDLFHGGQVVVLGRYRGTGHAALKLAGSVGKENKEFVYEVAFPEQTKDDREFVEHLWARRKVGYLLDQIRLNGEKKELVDETVLLAKKYGIATPYTSYLVVPDGPVPLAGAGGMRGGNATGFGMAGGGMAPAALARPEGAPQSVNLFLRSVPADDKEGLPKARVRLAEESERRGLAGLGESKAKDTLRQAQEKRATYAAAFDALKKSDRNSVQAGKLGVDLSVQMNNLRNQSQLEPTARQKVYGRNCLEIGGVWIDEDFDLKMPTLTVKAQCDGYFRLLEKKPQLKDVFRLGNHLVWVTPNGTALVIDTSEGKEKLTDAEIDRLFAAKK